MSFPDQRSTTDQLEDVATWAEDEGLTEAAAWVRAWDWHAPRPSQEDFIHLHEIARRHLCYDADDALQNIYSRGQWRYPRGNY